MVLKTKPNQMETSDSENSKKSDFEEKNQNTSKPKKEREYLCTQKINSKDICGKKDPTDFPKGRYSKCKDCRNKYVREFNKRVQEEEKNIKQMSIVEKINSSKGDLGKNVHDMIIHILETYPLNNIGIALPIKIDDIETNAVQDYMRHKYRIDDLEEELTKIKNKVKILESENQDLRRNLEKIKNNTINE